MKNKKLAVCKLTSPELQKRKAEVIATLSQSIIEKTEIDDGFVYRFEATDSTINELASFIITERMCCEFFVFDLKVDESDTWLTLTGPEGTKEFIQAELEF